MLLIFFCNFGLLLLASESFDFVLEGGGAFLTGGVFLTAAWPFFGLLAGEEEGAGGFLATGGGFFDLGGATFAFFLEFGGSFFTGEESAELELVLEALVLVFFFWGEGLAVEAWEVSVSELLESLSEEEDEELLLLLELESSVLDCKIEINVIH